MNARSPRVSPAETRRRNYSLLDATPALTVLTLVTCGMWMWMLVDDPAAGPMPTWVFVSVTLCAATMLGVTIRVKTLRSGAWTVGAREAFLAVYWLTAALAPLLSVHHPSRSLLDTASGHGSLMVAGLVWSTTAVACVFAYRTETTRSVGDRAEEPALSKRRVTEIGIVMAIAGAAALWARFPTWGVLEAYFQADYAEVSRTASGVSGYIGSILRPLLPAGVLFLWLQRRGLVLGLILAAAAVVALGSFSFNRAAVLVPVVGFVVARQAQGSAVSNRVLIALAAAALVAFVLVGTVRTETLNTEGGRYQTQATQTTLGDSVVESLQVYGQSPVRTGRIVDGQDSFDVGAAQLANSLLSPVPGVPSDIRSGTVTRHYNQLLYGSRDTSDQVIPLPLEAWWSLGLAGVLGAGALIGAALRHLDRRLRNSDNLAEAIVFSIAGLWAAQSLIVSSTVLVQTALYLGPSLLVVLYLSRRVTE